MSGTISFRKNSDTFHIHERLKQGSASLDELEIYMKTINKDIKRSSIRGKLSYLKSSGVINKNKGYFSVME